MKGKLRLILGLAVVVLGLCGVLYYDDWKTKAEKEEEKTKDKLAEFKPEDVQEVDYQTKGFTVEETDAAAAAATAPKTEPVQVIAVKKDGVWRLTKPVDALADGATIDSLIKTVTDYSYAKVITDKRDKWADFGLLEPQRHVTLRVGGDHPSDFTVYLGNKAPVGYNVYLRTSKDDKVLVGSQHVLLSTSKTLNDFRDKTLVKIDESKLKNLTYQRQGEPLIEASKADGKYSLVKPEKLDADAAAIKEFVDELNGVRVAGFFDNPDEATKALFQKPAYVITWQGETGEASTLKIAEASGKLIAAFDATQRAFALPDELKTKLKKDLTDFRNRRILDPDLLDAKTVEIDGEVFKDVEGNWYAAADAAKFDDKGKFAGAEKDKPQEKAHVRAFMVDLEFAKTDRFLGPTDAFAADATKGAPEHRITLRYHDAAKPALTIELFKAPDAPDRYLVKRSGAPYVYRVAKSAFNSMTPSPEPAPGDKAKAGGPDDLPLDEEGAPGVLDDTSSSDGKPVPVDKPG